MSGFQLRNISTNLLIHGQFCWAKITKWQRSSSIAPLDVIELNDYTSTYLENYSTTTRFPFSRNKSAATLSHRCLGRFVYTEKWLCGGNFTLLADIVYVSRDSGPPQFVSSISRFLDPSIVLWGTTMQLAYNNKINLYIKRAV